MPTIRFMRRSWSSFVWLCHKKSPTVTEISNLLCRPISSSVFEVSNWYQTVFGKHPLIATSCRVFIEKFYTKKVCSFIIFYPGIVRENSRCVIIRDDSSCRRDIYYSLTQTCKLIYSTRKSYFNLTEVSSLKVDARVVGMSWVLSSRLLTSWNWIGKSYSNFEARSTKMEKLDPVAERSSFGMLHSVPRLFLHRNICTLPFDPLVPAQHRIFQFLRYSYTWQYLSCLFYRTTEKMMFWEFFSNSLTFCKNFAYFSVVVSTESLRPD